MFAVAVAAVFGGRRGVGFRGGFCFGDDVFDFRNKRRKNISCKFRLTVVIVHIVHRLHNHDEDFFEFREALKNSGGISAELRIGSGFFNLVSAEFPVFEICDFSVRRDDKIIKSPFRKDAAGAVANVHMEFVVVLQSGERLDVFAPDQGDCFMILSGELIKDFIIVNGSVEERSVCGIFGIFGLPVLAVPPAPRTVRDAFQLGGGKFVVMRQFRRVHFQFLCFQ